MAQVNRLVRPNVGLILSIGLALSALVIVGVLVLLGSGSSDANALVIGPILLLLSLPFLSRRATLEGDRWLYRVMVLALVLKLVGAFVRYYVAFDVYGGVADAAGYHDFGVQIADRFRAGDFDTGLETLIGTDFIRFLTGLVYTLVGSSSLGGFLVFSWLGFWGLYFFYRAFALAVPEGRAHTYARLVFFLPSLLFWPSSVGKESWMILTLGVAAFGIARIMTGKLWRGLLVAGFGMLGAAQVRPHVAGLVGIALAVGYLVRPARGKSGQFAPVAKVVGVAALVVVALVLVDRTDEYLEQSAIETRQGVVAVIEETAERTQQGGSRFAPSILESPSRAPVAIGTILFRPLLIEADSLQTLAAALETTFLFGLALARFRWGLHAIRSIRRQPYVAFALAYIGLFIVAFSGIANFGILARERVQMLPFFLIFLAVPPPVEEEATEPDAHRAVQV
jgi:hypothetical protein